MKTQEQWKQEYDRQVTAGNLEGIREAAKNVEWSAEALRVMKEVNGAEFLRHYHVNVSKAETAFGAGWLDQ